MNTRLISIGLIVLSLAIAVQGAMAFEINNYAASESCIVWTYTQHGQDGFTLLYFDGIAHLNQTGDTLDQGFIVLCNLPPATCHRLEGTNETDEGMFTGETVCTTGLDWDVKLIGIFVFAAWVIFFVLTNFYNDGIFSLLTLMLSGIAYRDAFLTSAYLEVAGTDAHVNIAVIMLFLSLYLLYVTWSQIITKWRYKRATMRPETEKEYDNDT